MAKQKPLSTIRTSFKEIGFGSKSFSDLDRLILKDGTFNVERKGIGWKGFSLYHWLLNMHWAWMSLFGLGSYILVNLLFACCYFLLGDHQLSAAEGLTGSDLFFHAFYFSTQTLTTVGFGSISPIGHGASLLAGFESMIGLLGFAFITSVIYGRFSKAKSKILFSKNILISPYRGITGLKFRIANAKKNQLIEMHARVMYSYLEKVDGISKRKYLSLPLEIDMINLFPLPWTIVHPIDEDSPILKKTVKDLKDEEAEFIVMIKGYDDTFNQVVHQLYSYRYDEVLSNMDFEPMFDSGKDKSTTVHLNMIDKVRSV